MIIKAISLKQPFANLIALEKKTLETRTWSTKYRGPLLIVSSKKPNIPPAGYAVAVVDLVHCRPMTVDDEEAAWGRISHRNTSNLYSVFGMQFKLPLVRYKPY